ncbi:MAG: UDP-N-acetylenolpyruvoylglucosamine reductase [Acidobacteria bacterium]|nr:UDP-N-acetylenolpyruvoylglucosamine reductase [Acidobacteriota bacterium]
MGDQSLMNHRNKTLALFQRIFGDRLRSAMPMDELTTLRAGGLAELFLETSRPDDLVVAVKVTLEQGVPLTVLGGGSNVLVGDGGLRGLVVRLRHGGIFRAGSHHVRAEGGVTMNGLVRWTIQRELAGLERWAGTPGSIGGAIHGNAHFDGRLVSDIVSSVGLVDSTGAVRSVSQADMCFGYDDSRVKHSDERVLWAEFKVAEGDPTVLRASARRSLGFRKSTQPLGLASAGCVFQNPRLEDGPLPDDVPRSAGALIEQAGLKGRRVGRAVVSSVHGNFIVNEGGATAYDIRQLVEICRAAVFDCFGIVLRDELVYLGEFDSEL